MKSTILREVIAIFVVIVAAGNTARADLAGPYTADGNTLHLWHLDEATIPAIDSVASGAVNLAFTNTFTNITTTGSAVFNTTAFSGFGKCVNFTDGGGTATTAQGEDAALWQTKPVSGVGQSAPIQLWDATTGAFTMEALVKINFNPAQDFSAISNHHTISGAVSSFMIMSGESATTANREFQFRLNGSNVLGAGIGVALSFNNLRDSGGAQGGAFYATVPTSGPDAISQNGWFHVAVTYNGVPNTTDNLKFYWTLMNASRTSANRLTPILNSTAGQATTLNGPYPLSGASPAFCIGNTGRTDNANFVGDIDEVRISNIERSSVGMMFNSGSTVAIGTQPASQFAAVGDTVTLSVGASGIGPLYYQWQLGGANVADATNSSLTLANIMTTEAGSYQVIVSNLSSSATSSTAVVQVGLPVSGLFNTGVDESGAVLAGGALDAHWALTVSPDSLFPGPAAYVLTTPPGTWLTNGPNSEWITPGNSDTASLSGNYTYQTSFILDTEDPTQAQISGNWVSGNQGMDILINGVSLGIGNSTSAGTFTPFTITNGFVAGTNSLAFVVNRVSGLGMTGNRVELRGVGAPLGTPTGAQILASPSDTTGVAGRNATLTVSAVGSAPLSYRWYFGNTPLAGQTNYTLRLTGLTTEESGSYTVVVSNSLNSATSTVAVLTVTPPSTVAWLGTNSGAWDTSTVNWLDTGNSAATNYIEGDNVIFDSRGSGATSVNLQQQVTPNSILVSNDTTFSYIFSTGSFSPIAGNITLTKSGTGTLTMDTPNIYSGVTLIQGGTLQVGNGDANGTLGSSAVSNSAVLAFNRSDSNTFANVISGPGSVTMAGSSDLSLTGNNSYTGGTLISSGTVHPKTATALGTNGTVTVASGAKLYLDANVNIAGEALLLGGTGATGIDALRKGGSGTSIFGGPITLTADAVVTVDNASALTLTNPATITGTNFNLGLKCNGTGVLNVNGTMSLGSGGVTLPGTGSVVLTGTNNNWTGPTTISAGSLTVGDGGLPLNGSGYLGATEVDGSLTFLTSANFGIDGSLLTGASTGMITFNGSSTVVLSNATTYSGTNRIFGSGALRLAPGVNLGPGQLTIGNAQTDTSRLELTGNNLVTSPINMVSPRAFTQRNNAPIIINISGTNTVSPPGGIVIPVGGNLATLESDSGDLIYTGFITSGNSARDFCLQGSGTGEVNGAITNGVSSNTILLYKLGTGTWKLNGHNNYTTTTISSGTLLVNGTTTSTGVTVAGGGALGGTGTIVAAVTVNSGAMLAPSLAAGAGTPIGTLNISGALTLQGGSAVSMQFNKTAGTSDEVVGMSSLAYGGSLILTNLAGTLAAGDAFKLFNATAYSGGFAGISPATPGANLAWDVSTLTTDGTIRVAAVASTPTFLKPGLSDGQIVLSGTGGAPGGSFVLVSSTNVAAPLTNWIRVSTNVFDGSGNFSLTNAVQLSDRERFFILLKQ